MLGPPLLDAVEVPPEVEVPEGAVEVAAGVEVAAAALVVATTELGGGAALAEAALDLVFMAGDPGAGSVAEDDGPDAVEAAEVPAPLDVPAAGVAAPEPPAGADMPAAKAQTLSHTAWPAVGRQMSATAFLAGQQDHNNNRSSGLCGEKASWANKGGERPSQQIKDIKNQRTCSLFKISFYSADSFVDNK